MYLILSLNSGNDDYIPPVSISLGPNLLKCHYSINPSITNSDKKVSLVSALDAIVLHTVGLLHCTRINGSSVAAVKTISHLASTI